MILYPTETLYGLGVNALDPEELAKLYKIKQHEEGKVASWLVRNVADIAHYAEISPVAVAIAERFMPGSLTLVVPIKEGVLSKEVLAADGTIGFRVSSDVVAEKIIDAFMEEYNAPLTCTSANVSGAPTLPTPSEILQQFGPNAHLIDEIHDDGPRKGLASTVVRVIGDEVTVLREGSISELDIKKVVMGVV